MQHRLVAGEAPSSVCDALSFLTNAKAKRRGGQRLPYGIWNNQDGSSASSGGMFDGGFRNFGATCYISSSIRFLTSSPHFCAIVMAYRPVFDPSPPASVVNLVDSSTPIAENWLADIYQKHINQFSDDSLQLSLEQLQALLDSQYTPETTVSPRSDATKLQLLRQAVMLDVSVCVQSPSHSVFSFAWHHFCGVTLRYSSNC